MFTLSHKPYTLPDSGGDLVINSAALGLVAFPWASGVSAPCQQRAITAPKNFI